MSWNGAEHAKLSIESGGHPVWGWFLDADFTGEPGGGDGIIYRPARSPSDAVPLPSSGDDPDGDYKLVNLFPDLWVQQLFEARRDAEHSAACERWGTLKGDESGTCGDGTILRCSENKAHLPSAWDDTGEGFLGIGEDGLPGGLLALDPAFILNDYFNGTVTQNTYSDNWYLTSLLNEGYGTEEIPRGWPGGLDIGDLLAKAPPSPTP